MLVFKKDAARSDSESTESVPAPSRNPAVYRKSNHARQEIPRFSGLHAPLPAFAFGTKVAFLLS